MKNQKITSYVALMFDDIPYSEEKALAREKIEAALNAEFDKIDGSSSNDSAFEELIEKYGKLSQMARLAGYPEGSAEKWRTFDKAVSLSELKKTVRKQRVRAYITALFAAFTLLIFFRSVYLLITKPSAAWGNFIITTLAAMGAFIPFRKYRKAEKTAGRKKYDTAAYKFLQSGCDRYSKRLINSIALMFAISFILAVSQLITLWGSGSKSAEFIESILQNGILIEIPIFILVKNIMCLRIFSHRIKTPHGALYKKHVIIITSFSALYWLVSALFTVLFSKKFAYPTNVLDVCALIFCILIFAYNMTLRKKITYKNIVVNKPRIAVVTSAAVLISGTLYLQRDTWYTQRYINSVPIVEHNTHKIDYDDNTGIYTITKTTDDFKILHLTDIHIGGSLYSYPKDMKALNACYTLIERTHPDLVVVTGDMCFPMGIMSLSLNNAAPVHQFAAFMRNTGVPWAFTYGNHDTESVSTLDKTELDEVYKSLSYKTSGNLLYPYVQPEIMGRNNQLIELRNADGTLNTGLFLIDSNAYTGEGINTYDYIHDDQVDWYAEQVERLNDEAGHTVDSLVFFHVPLQEYRIATELYLSGSNEVKHYFGENPGDHGGITNDRVCCSDYPSKLFDTALALGSTTGFFCGHDHYNNASLEYKGIRLTYGMSIDYLAMPGIEKETKQRGAELITIHSDADWELEQVPLAVVS